MATCPYRGRPSPPAASNISISSGFGSVAIITSAYSAASAHESGPETASPIGTPSSGRSRGRDQCRPRVRRMALLLKPWVVVVGADREVEAGPLRADRVVHQFCRAALLAHQRVSELNHRRPLAEMSLPQGGSQRRQEQTPVRSAAR